MLPLAVWLALAAPEARVARDGAVEAVGHSAQPGDTLTLHAGDASRPAMLGESRVAGGVVRFVPRFPLKPGLRYVAVLKSGGKEHRLPLLIPARKREPSAFVEAVYPTADRLPENLLKFYIHFSAPMSQGGSYAHIQLVDDKGKPGDMPFLELDQELWSPDGKRFTLFIDPGRIKRFLKPREDLGPALEQGRKYRLVIDRAWRDEEGTPMKASFTKEFTVGPPDESQPDLKKWKVTSPAPGKAPLRVAFGKPMDHALALRVIWVEDASGKRIPGKASLAEKESAWLFTPDEAWNPGEYHLAADATLEDLSGNSLGRPFEVDILRPVEKKVVEKVFRRSFQVK
jgi:hypothetical protein